MNDQIVCKMKIQPTKATDNHIYTKLQVRYGGDVQDLVLKTEKEPNCHDLKKALEETFRVSADNQLVYFRGQRLHHHQQQWSNDYPLSKFGIFSGNTVTLIGKRT